MKRASVIAIFLVAGFFIFGLIRLFNLRFETGDIYPRYSSLRADPLGTKALYESLDHIVPTSRHLQPWSKLGEGRGSTLLFLGAEPEGLKFRKDELQRLESFIAGGGRLVISLVTQYRKRPAPITTGDEERLIPAGERWDFDFAYAALPKDEAGEYSHAPARRLVEVSQLPLQITWHTAIYFRSLGSEWKTVYAISNDLPVLIERRLGDGQIVICSDPYLFSNEALLAERRSELLSWLIGPARRVIFDETHLGIREEPGLATLARRYRLQGLAAALLVLALLFVWKNAVPFVPAGSSISESASIKGRETAAGFANLLRRNIPPGELIGICISEWKKSCSQRISRERLKRVQELIDTENQLAPSKRDPIRIYQTLTRILNSRNPNDVPRAAE
jgi:hypothetical protein